LEKNNGMIRLGLKYEPKIKCQSLKWNYRNTLRLKMRGEAHSNLLCLKSEILQEQVKWYIRILSQTQLYSL